MWQTVVSFLWSAAVSAAIDSVPVATLAVSELLP